MDLRSSSPSHAFAPPVASTPDATWIGATAMGSAFRVGPHHVEVVTHHWTGRETYRVDGDEVASVRNLGWHADHRFVVGEHEVRVHGRWYPVLPVAVSVDDQPLIDDLFPQLAWLKVAVGAPVSIVSAVLGLSIVWDLWRLVQLS